MENRYQEFLQKKLARPAMTGFEVSRKEINPTLFAFQTDVVRWALRLGKAALFESVGLGKTIQQLEWARLVQERIGQPVIILAPLAVNHQTIIEAHEKLGLSVTFAANGDAVSSNGIYISNYERLEKLDASIFGGVVLDESSILKSFTGATKQAIIEAFRNTPYKLACTATPAPNDYLELGNHADFLDVMPGYEMIMRFFNNDTMKAGGYRLKKHADKGAFWEWLTSWAVCISKPRDLGAEYDMQGYDLPAMHIHQEWVGTADATVQRAWKEGKLFSDTVSATDIHKVKRESLPLRLQRTIEVVESLPNEPIVIWCEQNIESEALYEAFKHLGAVQVTGSEKPETKEKKLLAFTNGESRIIITKPSIAGMGLNWQHCAHAIFFSPSFSFENEYQAIGRNHRFGQKREVHVYMIVSETESNIADIVKTKRAAFDEMQKKMNAAMKKYGLFRDLGRMELSMPVQGVERGKTWEMRLGDCVQEIKHIEDNSVHLSIFSPPFANLYTYSDSMADMGNSSDDFEFFEHFAMLVPELFRITKPGRLVAIHCKDLPAYMNRDGYAGLRDFPGEIVRMMELYNLNPVNPPDLTGLSAIEAYQVLTRWQRETENRKPETAGFRYHSRFNIWKDPVIEMQRTKNHGLLHKNFTERGEAVRQGMADYMLVFRKWPLDDNEPSVKHNFKVGDYVGANPPTEAEYKRFLSYDDAIDMEDASETPDAPISPEKERRLYSIASWQRYASPVWDDIDQTDVLNYKMARGQDDEKHIAPLQLGVIRKAIQLWTNPGEVVFSPFGGIGSEPYVAVQMGRIGKAIELKPEYHAFAVKHLKEAERAASQRTLFDLMDEQAGD